ncbi:MAG: hypothetical protein ACLRML_02520 [[Ruminococcus] lactaris]
MQMKVIENLYQSVKSKAYDCIYWDDAPVTSQSGGVVAAYSAPGRG